MRRRIGFVLLLTVALIAVVFFFYRNRLGAATTPPSISSQSAQSEPAEFQPSVSPSSTVPLEASPTPSLPAAPTSESLDTLRSTVAVPPGVLQPNCRFGVTAPFDFLPEQVSEIGVGGLLNWRSTAPDLPSGVEYVPVLRLRDDRYPRVLADLPETLAALPASAWVVGNEPDTAYAGQDGLTPEVYAQRFYEVATRIRSLDPKAQIGFGTIVQPTSLRLRYLQRAWDELVRLAGSSADASALIDFWSIHAFILNEWPEEWGSGVPPGFEEDFADAVHFTDFPFAETFTYTIFSTRVEAFRFWLAGIGERDKPLWITEYGSLFPPVDPPDGPDLVNVLEAQTSQFMVGTFDFLLTAANRETGMPADENRLVQRWFWYSLNDHMYNFGGTLYDPDNQDALTRVGVDFIAYLKSLPVGPDLLPLEVTLAQSTSSDAYRLDVLVSNAGSGPAERFQVSVYDGDPSSGGKLLAVPARVERLNGCGAVALVSFELQEAPPASVFVTVSLPNDLDLNPANDGVVFELPEVE